MEGSDQQLKQQLLEKEKQFEETKINLKKMLNSERGRFDQQTSEFKAYKEEAQKKQASMLQEVRIDQWFKFFSNTCKLESQKRRADQATENTTRRIQKREGKPQVEAQRY